MPYVTTDDGARIFYRLDGQDRSPVVLLSNSLGTALAMWDPQVPALAERYRVLRYDSRGHGRSDAPAGPYDIARLGRDAVALLDGLGIERAAFCGLSKGGMVGQWLGVNAASRIDRLILASTSAHIGAPEVWAQRIATVRAQGIAAIVPGVIDRWFTQAFRERSPSTVESVAAMLRATDPEGYVACCAAVRDMDQRDAIAAIRAPTLVLYGRHDLVTPLEHAQAIAERIEGAALVELDAAHLANIEAESAFTAAVLGFLAGPGAGQAPARRDA
jgi:3-oxoadipate enol-lactonase